MRNVAFDLAIKYSEGVFSSVGLNEDGLVVAVEQQAAGNALVQRLGRINVGAIDFAQPVPYGSGIAPSVAVTGGLVLEVHQAAGSNDLLYQFGGIANNALRFDDPQRYDSGANPVVAINANRVVVGLQAASAGGTDLFVRVGQARSGTDGKMTIDHWGPDDKSLLASRASDGAIAFNDRGFVVVAYRRPGAVLVAVGGQVIGNDIQWGTPFDYGRGFHPALALTNDGTIVEIHLEQQFDRTFACFSNVGSLDEKTRSVDFPSDRGNILAPVQGFQRRCNTISTLGPNFSRVAVAASGDLSIQTVSDSGNALGYSASLILDRANWMRDSLPALGGKVLRDLSITGSHDATAYVVNNCTEFGSECNSKTQDGTLFDQLQAGVRYFDIRPALHDNDLYTAHLGDTGALGAAALKLVNSVRSARILAGILGILLTDPVDRVQGCLGPKLADVLADVKKFLDGGAREVVILKFSHYQNFDSATDRRNGTFQFDEAQTTRLISEVVAALNDYLYRGPFFTPGDETDRNGRLASLPLNTLLRERGIVLPVFDRDGSVFKKQPGTFSYRDYQVRQQGAALVRRAPAPAIRPTIDPDDFPQFRSNDLLVYDQFTNSPDLEPVSADQLRKLRSGRNHGGDLFLFSWTLTQTDMQALGCTPDHSILKLATTADGALAAAVTKEYASGGITSATVPNILYVDRAAGFATDVSVWLNRRMALGDTLLADRRDYLAANDSLVSANGRYKLTYQPNGDLVVVHLDDDGAIDETRSISRTTGQPTWRCIMQGDGNFVIYSQPYVAVFASGTSGNPGAQLMLTDTGRLTIIDRHGATVPAPPIEV